MAGTAIHPGEHLGEELRELGMPAAELSRQSEVPVNGVTGVSRLALKRADALASSPCAYFPAPPAPAALRLGSGTITVPQ
ncbi:MAG: hypothetical protein WBW81_09645 [Methylocella sp.]